MDIGAHFCYDRDRNDDRCWGLLDVLQPRAIVVMSHTDPADLERLAASYPIRHWLIRMKSGPEKLLGYPSDNMVDWKEWEVEQSTSDAIMRAKSLGKRPKVIVFNEPDIEVPPPDTNANDYIDRAIGVYLDAARRTINHLRDHWGDELDIALAPISEGDAFRAGRWFAALEPLPPKVDFIAEHCYTNDRPYEDPDWGSRFRRWEGVIDRFGNQIAVHITEANDNGVHAGPGRAEDLAAYGRYVSGFPRVESLSYFVMPGGMGSMPEWWALAPTDMEAIVA